MTLQCSSTGFLFVNKPELSFYKRMSSGVSTEHCIVLWTTLQYLHTYIFRCAHFAKGEHIFSELYTWEPLSKYLITSYATECQYSKIDTPVYLTWLIVFKVQQKI